MIAMKVGRMMLLFFVISWMIIHFGINPDRGGSPPTSIQGHTSSECEACKDLFRN